jgi:hypothetical protein
MGIELVRTHSKWLVQDPGIGQWIDDALNPASNLVDVEQRAQNILDHLQVATSPTRSRYQFEVLSKREEVFQVIFNRVFEQNSNEIIAYAEALYPSRTFFYPQWKTVCLIQIPKTVADILDEDRVKGCLFVAMLVASFMINTGTVILITVGNIFLLMNIPSRVMKFLIGYTIGRAILIYRLPEIPYITPCVRRIISPLFFLIPDFSAVTEIIQFHIVDIFFFTLQVCHQTIYFLRGHAERAEEERVAICKAKTYEIWKSAVLANMPAAF